MARDCSDADPMTTLTLTPNSAAALRNAAEDSAASDYASAVLSGDWGLLAGPSITSFDGDDFDDADAVWSNDDELVIRFDMDTDQPTVTTKAVSTTTKYTTTRTQETAFNSLRSNRDLRSSRSMDLRRSSPSDSDSSS